MFPRMRPIPSTGLVIYTSVFANFILSLVVYMLCERAAITTGNKLVGVLVGAAWTMGALHTLVIVCITFFAINRAADRGGRKDLTPALILRSVAYCFGHTFLSLAVSCIGLAVLFVHVKPYPLPWGIFGIDSAIFYAVLVSIVPVACTSYMLAREKRLVF